MSATSDAQREILRLQVLSRYLSTNDISAEIVHAERGELQSPSLSKSSILTALTQNGALRLACDRSFVSLIDASTQYIVAEATRTVPLHNPYTKTNTQDDLFLGVQALDKNFGICPQSITIFTDSTGEKLVQTHNVVANPTRYVIRDLRNIDQYRNCAYVSGFPFMVSYAEVPIKSTSGQIIGTYCVMDNKVRDDFFTDETIDILTDIATSITEHLELQITKQDCDRGNRMMRGLSQFIEEEGSHVAEHCRLGKQRFTKPSNKFSDDYFADRINHRSRAGVPSSSDSSNSGRSSSETTSIRDRTPLTTPSETGAPETVSPSLLESPNEVEVGSATPVPDGQHSRQGFSRAAKLIRAAIDIEGLVFLDRSSDGEQSINHGEGTADHDSASICEILGSSIVPKGCNLGCLESPLALSRSSLDHLTKEFPHGCVLVADEQSIYASGEKSASTDQPFSHRPLDRTDQSSQSLLSLAQRGRSLIFLPLWDSNKEHFYVGMLGWSSDPTRVLKEQDLTCLSAFGKAFMTDMARSEMTELARAKSDFLCSISHELRSPLHGVLAAVEQLKDTEYDDEQADLIEMVQSCASTLLDTLNHLLDFSKVNGLVDAKTHARKSSNGDDSKYPQTAFGGHTKEYLCRLVQDVVEGVHFGHTSQRAAYKKTQKAPVDQFAGADVPSDPSLLIDSASSAKRFATTHSADVVAVYLDMESQSEWCVTLCAGAWKRLVMNLFANALKYTHRGFIEVSLRMITDPNNPKKRYAHLMVKDTGIGMSKEYMDAHLYQPFVQENYLADGTGLGLSIVKQIVDDLGGNINVKSTVGIGTRFDVFIPLPDQDNLDINTLPSGGEILDPNTLLKDRTLCLLSPPCELQSTNETTAGASVNNEREEVMHSYVKSIAESWFGMKVVTAQSPAEVQADIFLTEASHFNQLLQAGMEYTRESIEPRAILVGTVSSKDLSKSRLRDNTITLTYPIGPKSLSRALFNALKTSAEPDFPSFAEPNRTSNHNIDGESIERVSELTASEPKEQPIAEHVKLGQNPGDNHLLLVDDNAINLKLLLAYVKKLGFSAEVASDGSEAFEKVKAASSSQRINTVLMDISMPIMNGYESSRAIRRYEAQHPEVKPVRIIALTGLGSEASRREAELSGIDDFRTKPVALKVLKELLGIAQGGSALSAPAKSLGWSLGRLGI